MSENVPVTDETVESKPNMLVDAVRKVILAGIGAAKMAQEEVAGFVGDSEGYLNKIVEETEAFINKLVDKGAIAESDGKQLVADMMEKRRSVVKDSAEKAQSGLDKRVEDVLARLNIPTKSDVDELSKKIGQLSHKVDNLKKVQEQALSTEEAATPKTAKAAKKVTAEVANGSQEAADSVAA